LDELEGFLKKIVIGLKDENLIDPGLGALYKYIGFYEWLDDPDIKKARANDPTNKRNASNDPKGGGFSIAGADAEKYPCVHNDKL
jgi:hypothetical protein